MQAKAQASLGLEPMRDRKTLRGEFLSPEAVKQLMKESKELAAVETRASTELQEISRSE